MSSCTVCALSQIQSWNVLKVTYLIFKLFKVILLWWLLSGEVQSLPSCTFSCSLRSSRGTRWSSWESSLVSNGSDSLGCNESAWLSRPLLALYLPLPLPLPLDRSLNLCWPLWPSVPCSISLNPLRSYELYHNSVHTRYLPNQAKVSTRATCWT